MNSGAPPSSGADARGWPLPQLLSRFPAVRPPVSMAGAAVTMVLRTGRSDVEVLLIERAPNLNDPASGQVALPGGRVEERDGSLAATAVRELEEEVGIGANDLREELRFVTAEPAPRFGLKVAVFAAELARDGRQPAARNQREVAHVFWMPRSHLGDTVTRTEETYRGAAQVRATVFDNHVVWGFTRRILRDFFGFPSEDEVVGPLFAPKGLDGSATEGASSQGEERDSR